MSKTRTQAQTELNYRETGVWDEYGDDPVDSEDYGYLEAEGRSVPRPRLGLWTEISALGEKAEEDEYFRGLQEEQEAEERQRRAEAALTDQALKAARDAMTPEQQEAALREANQKFAEKNLAASRDESRDYNDRRLFFKEAVRRSQQGAHLDLTEREQLLAEEIKRTWKKEEEKHKVEG
ncbi:MAG: hypothetical protein Q4A37_03115 [Candidatus Saccharibacteria bacterium]|nr:hypothetical protein [Candidatus Saccharibacteria bacterium]